MRLGAWLALCALTLRLLVPVGYMPAPRHDGRLPTLVICTAQGAQAVSVDDQDQRAKDKGPARKPGVGGPDHGCVFAAHGASLPTDGANLVASPVAFDVAERDHRHADQRPGLGLAAPPPPKTGPPAIA